MGQPRIHITGAAGTGVTTLGQMLAERLNIARLDTDAFYWQPTDPPFTCRRPRTERLRLIRDAQALARDSGWVLAGSLMGWGDPLVTEADLIVFLSASWPVRRARLEAREAARYGARIAPGGDMHTIHREFMTWASQYDQAFFLGRSRMAHEAWLEDQEQPVLRLDGTTPREGMVEEVMAVLPQALATQKVG